ncbi:hypothetical protein BC830DRAFT_1085238 [Chytriomyces sp. MP71]|nr:hypothetical protein BC830DRAFT_1085238 [Chytriomyces sp. MP71]
MLWFGESILAVGSVEGQLEGVNRLRAFVASWVPVTVTHPKAAVWKENEFRKPALFQPRLRVQSMSELRSIFFSRTWTREQCAKSGEENEALLDLAITIDDERESLAVATPRDSSPLMGCVSSKFMRVTSIVMVLVNKAVLTQNVIDLPLTFLWLQLLVAVFLLSASSAMVDEFFLPFTVFLSWVSWTRQSAGASSSLVGIVFSGFLAGTLMEGKEIIISAVGVSLGIASSFRAAANSIIVKHTARLLRQPSKRVDTGAGRGPKRRVGAAERAGGWRGCGRLPSVQTLLDLAVFHEVLLHARILSIGIVLFGSALHAWISSHPQAAGSSDVRKTGMVDQHEGVHEPSGNWWSGADADDAGNENTISIAEKLARRGPRRARFVLSPVDMI